MLPDGLIVADSFSGKNALKDTGFFRLPVLRNEKRQKISYCLLSRIAEKLFGPAIPGLNSTIQVQAEDGIIRRAHDGCQMRPQGFFLTSFRDINQHITTA